MNENVTYRYVWGTFTEPTNGKQMKYSIIAAPLCIDLNDMSCGMLIISVMRSETIIIKLFLYIFLFCLNNLNIITIIGLTNNSNEDVL